MNSGFYSALTGLMARFQSLNLLAGNLANVSTTGYKAQVPFYEALDVAQGRAATAPLDQAINDFGFLVVLNWIANLVRSSTPAAAWILPCEARVFWAHRRRLGFATPGTAASNLAPMA